MRVHCLCLIPQSQMVKQPKICMLLISSHCQSLFSPPDWGFPPSSPISFLLNVQMSSIDRTPSPLKPLWPPRGSMLMLWGMTGKSHQRLQVGKEPSSMAGAGKQLGKSHFLLWPCLCSTVTRKAALQLGRYKLWAVEWLQSWTSRNGRSAGSVLCSMERDPWG